MPDWLDDFRLNLDKLDRPVQWFFRDDDAGWSNDRLFELLDRFAQSGIPIDIAAIPEAMDQNTADELLSRWRQTPDLIGIHQHGFSHHNHETAGRKCEFGGSRTKAEQKEDIARGQQRLRAYFGQALDPIFTPPWNRCTQITVDCLEELDFKLLSRDAKAEPLRSAILKQIPVHVDWSRIIKTSAQPLVEFGQVIIDQLQNNDLTGIMLHHTDMDTANLKTLSELLTVLSAHSNVRNLLLNERL